MKCAREILEMRDLAELEYQLEQATLDAKAALDFEEAKKNAIDFCDTAINAALELSANRREDNPTASYRIARCTDRLGHQLCQVISPDGRRYADGKLSYAPGGSFLALVTLEDYLADHCFIVTFDDATYPMYGAGSRKCQQMNISALPQE